VWAEDAFQDIIHADEVRIWVSLPPNGSWYLIADIVQNFTPDHTYGITYRPTVHPEWRHNFQVREHANGFWCAGAQVLN
jgi:hypothetical protein